jgi:uncharacterized membrane protein
MTLSPLLAADLAVRLHAAPALLALVLGAIQLVRPKGTRSHRMMGWTWVILMTLVSASSFFIHTICTVGPFSIIHLLSILTLLILPFAVHNARQHRVVQHARAMKLLFLGALVIAGAFTLMPGRIMHDVVFDTVSTHGSCAG